MDENQAQYDAIDRINKAIGHFCGYTHFNGFTRCSQTSLEAHEYWRRTGQVQPMTKEDIKGCLFFEVRAFRHCGGMSEENIPYIDAMLEELNHA